MLNSTQLKTGLARWVDAVQAAASELNELDGRLGDGDLGTTLDKCAANVRASLPDMPNDLAGIFKGCASACAKASGSSFGTLLAVAFVTAAKNVGSADVLSRQKLVELLDSITATLSARGGAVLGDKTMLDSIEAAARALEGATDTADLRPVLVDATQVALDTYRDKPNKIGRARMFADKSVGMSDPGMVAVLRMTQSL